MGQWTMGRLAGEGRSDRDLAYLLMLARRHDLEPVDLHRALVRAQRGKRSTCGSLSIELRQREDNRICFMFSRDKQSIAQAAISENSLAKLRHIPPEFNRVLNKEDQASAADQSQTMRRIADLRVGLRNVCLRAIVTEKSEVRALESKNGTPLTLCLATLSDDTGKIQLALWNNRVHSVAKNDTVIIRGATVTNLRGQMQLRLPWKTGTVSTVDPRSGPIQESSVRTNNRSPLYPHPQAHHQACEHHTNTRG
mgnify:CR=1 FL=1